PPPRSTLFPYTTLFRSVECGLVLPGATLCDAKRSIKALVRADGSIALGDSVGSIHRTGALAQGITACNGWAFWHLETADGLIARSEEHTSELQSPCNLV